MTIRGYLIIDTETTGLFDFTKPADAPGQPYLAELAMVRTDAEVVMEDIETFLIKPEGWVMPAAAGAVNGLTTERLEAEGVPVAYALDAYVKAVGEGYIVAAFNAQFDTKIMRAALRRAGRPDMFETTPNICIMRALTGVCKIPKKDGKGIKNPKLSEALAYFKIEGHAGHSAHGDAYSAYQLLKWLKRLDLMPVPEVKYAKNRPEGSV